MKILKLKSILFSLMAIAMVTVFLTSCEKDVIKQDLITDYETAEKVMETYIVEKNNVFVLTERDPYKLGIDPKIVEELTQSFDMVNQRIEEGEIKAERINNSQIELRGCEENKVDFGWFTFTIYISSNNASWINTAVGWLPIPSTANKVKDILFNIINNYFCTCGFKYKASYAFPTHGVTYCQ